eukprot:Awhi_evm1s5385
MKSFANHRDPEEPFFALGLSSTSMLAVDSTSNFLTENSLGSVKKEKMKSKEPGIDPCAKISPDGLSYLRLLGKTHTSISVTAAMYEAMKKTIIIFLEHRLSMANEPFSVETRDSYITAIDIIIKHMKPAMTRKLSFVNHQYRLRRKTT